MHRPEEAAQSIADELRVVQSSREHNSSRELSVFHQRKPGRHFELLDQLTEHEGWTNGNVELLSIQDSNREILVDRRSMVPLPCRNVPSELSPQKAQVIRQRST